MSKPILPQIIATTQARGFTFTLIQELGFLHHDRYGYAFPSLAYLAKKLRVAVRTIQRHLAKLEAMGELIIERVHGRGLNNRYYLKLLGFAPDPAQKHDRWARLKDRIHAAFSKKHDNVAAGITDATPTQTGPIDLDRPEMRNPLWCEGCHVIHQGRCGYRDPP